MAELLAPMGGKVLKVLVEAGAQVNEDDELVILEAMKMELPISAEQSGRVVEVKVQPGQTVETNQVLLTIE